MLGVRLLDITVDRGAVVEHAGGGVDAHLVADTQPTRGFGFIPAPIEFDKPQPQEQDHRE